MTDTLPSGSPSAELLPGLAPPRRAPRRSRTWLPAGLAVIATGVTLALGGTWWQGRQDLDDTRREIAELKARHLVHLQRVQVFQQALDTRFTAAALDAKLAATEERDQAVVEYVNSSALSNGDQLRRMLVLQSDCLAAVLAYDHAAGAFSPRMRGSLPAHVDMTQTNPTCLVSPW